MRSPASARGWGWRFDLALTFVERSLRLRTKRSLLAHYWPLIAPIFLTALWVFIGRGVFSVEIPHYELFLFAGVSVWVFVAATILRSLMTLSGESAVINRGRIPYEVLPLSHVAASAIYLFATLAALAVFTGVRGWIEPQLLPLLVLPIATLILLVSSISLLLAVIDVHNRDVRQVLPNLITVWFFTTPIIYRPDMLPDWARPVIELNPASPIVASVRALLVEGHSGDVAQISIALACCAALFGISLFAFRRVAQDIARVM